jgi:uncharacterized protein YbaR (Trm112 family)
MARQQAAMPATSAAIDSLICPTCGTAMRLTRVAPLENMYEQHSLVCERCDRWDNIIVFRFDSLPDAPVASTRTLHRR